MPSAQPPPSLTLYVPNFLMHMCQIVIMSDAIEVPWSYFYKCKISSHAMMIMPMGESTMEWHLLLPYYLTLQDQYTFCLVSPYTPFVSLCYLLIRKKYLKFLLTKYFNPFFYDKSSIGHNHTKFSLNSNYVCFYYHHELYPSP